MYERVNEYLYGSGPSNVFKDSFKSKQHQLFHLEGMDLPWDVFTPVF